VNRGIAGLVPLSRHSDARSARRRSRRRNQEITIKVRRPTKRDPHGTRLADLFASLGPGMRIGCGYAAAEIHRFALDDKRMGNDGPGGIECWVIALDRA